MSASAAHSSAHLVPTHLDRTLLTMKALQQVMEPRGPTASAFWPAMETDERGQFLGVNLTTSATKT